jgi:hypothetical protein
MKTAMQELIDLIKLKQYQSVNEWQSGYQLALNDILFETEKFIKYEQEQIENAMKVSYKVGWEEAFKFIKETLTYNQNK